jgi:hypothetical protein
MRIDLGMEEGMERREIASAVVTGSPWPQD